MISGNLNKLFGVLIVVCLFAMGGFVYFQLTSEKDMAKASLTIVIFLCLLMMVLAHIIEDNRKYLLRRLRLIDKRVRN